MYFIPLRQVETIGDAYMVVGGLPIPMASHAARIANQALGMMFICKEVMSPVTREPIGVSNYLQVNLFIASEKFNRDT